MSQHAIVVVEAGECYLEEVDRYSAAESIEDAKSQVRYDGYPVIDTGDRGGGYCIEDSSGQETVYVVTVAPDWATLVREIRDGRDLTQAEAAEQIGVSEDTLSRWETGRHEPSTMACRAINTWVEALE